MSIGLVFAHGWGFDSSYFEKLGQYFADYPQVHWEKGYFTTAEPYITFPGKGAWIGIGHSFGFHQLLKYPFKGVVSLAGFTRFCIHRKGQEGVPLRILDRMIKAFQHDPQAVLQQFWGKCSFTAYQENSYINTRALLTDLKAMRELEEEPLTNIPILSLSSQQDPIVPPSLIQQNFEGHPHLTRVKLPYKHHILGCKDIQACTHHIKNWIQNVHLNCPLI
jgi:pimeloyl-[acyl-carrier protein] methyl ester esterase